ncbi:phasin family protein [Halalkalibacterium ligniniphilum]|uniref:phasin family protein n=1 Tax=Halalkalibacterium ligniniphilum TaxID=1134413 RepID=UPI0004772964|nr:ATP synthase subunit B [Halalkalibacterium ligniniphilum]
MKDTVKKGLALGLGLAVTSKEQAEKIVDELVKKGELSKHESKDFMRELMNKGEETQNKIDESIQIKLKQLLGELNLATKDDIQALEQRLNQLEKQLKKPE